MIEIGNQLINPEEIVSAEVETRAYVNGAEHQLVLNMRNGSRMRFRHGFGFDAWAALDKLKHHSGTSSSPRFTRASPGCK